jgi:AraC-like DNA-binding protein
MTMSDENGFGRELDQPRVERFSVSSGTLQARLGAWSELVSTTMAALDMAPSHRTPVDFRGVLRRQRFGALALVDCCAYQSIGHRRPVLNDGPEAMLGVQIVRRGTEVVRGQNVRRVIGSGDVVLWDGRRTVDVEIVEPVYKRVVLFPLDAVAATCPRLIEQPLPPSLGASATARLLIRYVNALAEELPDLDDAGRAVAASTALELLKAAVEPALPETRSATRAALREDIRRYVRGHLRDPDLTPSSIAEAYSMSTRALHLLFDDVAESVAGLVRAERLSRCRDDLLALEAESVSAIGRRWGFPDPAHFSRAFKHAYGQSPRAVRHAANSRHSDARR